MTFTKVTLPCILTFVKVIDHESKPPVLTSSQASAWLARSRDTNPWWAGAPFESGVPRDGIEGATRWLGGDQALALIGMRRVGKSTLLKQIARHLIEERHVPASDLLAVHFEELEFIDALESPSLFDDLMALHRDFIRPTGLPWLLLDEVQNTTHWARFVRMAVDQRRAHVVVTGSSSRLLTPELATVLTGRSIRLEVWPLSFREFLRFRGREPSASLDPGLQASDLSSAVVEFLEFGGLPAVVTDVEPRRRTERLRQTFSDILFRDIVARHQVRAVRALEQVAHYLLTNTARAFTYQALKNRYGLAMDQVRSYVEYLEEAYLIGLVPKFSWKVAEQSRAPRKAYAVDTGLRNAVAFRFSEDIGGLSETAVYRHLRQSDDAIYYFEDAHHECDFVMLRGGAPAAAVQVCASSDAMPGRELSGLLAAMAALELSHGVIVTGRREEVLTLPEGTVRLVPLWRFLLGSGVQG